MDCVNVLERADLILHTGDLTAASVLDELGAFAPVVAVHGNMDEPALRAALPGRLVVEASPGAGTTCLAEVPLG